MYHACCQGAQYLVCPGTWAPAERVAPIIVAAITATTMRATIKRLTMFCLLSPIFIAGYARLTRCARQEQQQRRQLSPASQYAVRQDPRAQEQSGSGRQDHSRTTCPGTTALGQLGRRFGGWNLLYAPNFYHVSFRHHGVLILRRQGARYQNQHGH